MATRQEEIRRLEAERAALEKGVIGSRMVNMGGRLGRIAQRVSSDRLNSIDNRLSELRLDPEWAAQNPDKAQAELTRRQWELYERRGMGLEDSVLAEITDPATAERAATRAGISAREAFAGAGAMTDRRLERHGVQATAEQRAGAARRTDLARAMAIGGAKQDAREATREDNIDLLSGTLNVGAGLSSAATQGLESAASMQNQRVETAKAQRAAHTQSMISTGLTLGAAIFAI